MVEVGEEVFDVLETERDADDSIGDAGIGPGLGSHRPVGCGGRMSDQCLGVTEVAGDVDDLKGVEEPKSRAFAHRRRPV